MADKVCNKCQIEKASGEFYKHCRMCKACYILRQKEWYLQNKERNYVNSRHSIAADPERRKAWARKERSKPSAKLRQRLHNLKRLALEKGADGFHTPADIRVLMQKQNGCCNHCGCNIRSKYHIDHIIALTLGGSNWPCNLQLLCPPCNVKKGGKTLPLPTL